MRVIVTGSHGLIGGALAESLVANGHDVTRLVRAQPKAGEARWDPDAGTIDAAALEGHDAAVHLGGVGIGDHRWTDEHKAAVLDSRLKGTSLLASTLAGLDSPPKVLASGSAVGFYGDRGDEKLTEQSSPGRGFLADVVQKWEAAATPASDAGIRVVRLRSGVVLSEKGGALEKQLLPFKMGLGGRLGSGRQWLSWITLEDEISAIRHLLSSDDVEGPVNVTAPNPVTNADFTKALGRALHRPTVFPTPKMALHAMFGEEMVAEMLLAGQRVLPVALTASGFTFAQPEIEGALRSVLGP